MAFWNPRGDPGAEVENVSSVSPYMSLKVTKMGRRYIAQVADAALSTNLT